MRLEIQGITKRYPGVVALNHVDFTLSSSHVHALVGENGAGKSTLIKILAGVLHPDEGCIKKDGKSVVISTPHRARQLGISVVHQHSHLIPDLSIAENYALRVAYPRTPLGTISWRTVSRKASDAIRILIPSMDVHRTARSLSGVERQLVELSFAFSCKPDVIILDEPTAVLPEQETGLLFQRVSEFARSGGTVVFVSHRLDEVFRIADDVTVLRDGEVVWRKDVGDTDHDDLIRAMVGRSVTFQRDPECVPREALRLECQNLRTEQTALQIREGEIFGVYGLVGSGQSELCQALFGLREPSRMGVRLNGREIGNATPSDRVHAGLAYVPSDRLEQGLFCQMTVGENMSLASLGELTRLGLINERREREVNETFVEKLRVKTQGLTQRVNQLSGGNQQKVLLARWLESQPVALILEEPTQGVDVGAKGEIHRIITDLAKSGVSIVLISSEIPELMALSHRIRIMRQGELVAELDANQTTEDDILRLALPGSADQVRNNTTSLPQSRHSTLARLSQRLFEQRELSIALFIVLVAVVFGLTTPGFATWRNLSDVLINNAIVLIGALGITFVIISGGIDISVGAIMGLAAVAAGMANQSEYASSTIALLALCVGAVLGMLNGSLSVLGGIHPIIITLGMLSILRGVLIHVTGGRWILNLTSSATVFGQTQFLGVSVLLYFALLAIVASHGVLRYTKSGRRLYALGGDRNSAEMLGIYPRHIVPLAFGICGLFMGLAGLLHAGRYGQVQTNVGMGFELKVIAAAVIGGTHIMGGRGSALGTLLGTILIGLITNVLVLTHVSTFWEGVVVGAMILLAVGADAFVSRQRGMAE